MALNMKLSLCYLELALSTGMDDSSSSDTSSSEDEILLGKQTCLNYKFSKHCTFNHLFVRVLVELRFYPFPLLLAINTSSKVLLCSVWRL